MWLMDKEIIIRIMNQIYWINIMIILYIQKDPLEFINNNSMISTFRIKIWIKIICNKFYNFVILF